MLHVRLALPAQACGSTGDPKTGPSNAVGLKIGGTQLGKSIGEPKSKHIFKSQIYWTVIVALHVWDTRMEPKLARGNGKFAV